MSLCPDIGEVVGEYRFEQVLGEGGFGIVYKATELSLNRPVAVKTLKPIWSGSEEFSQRFRRGAKALARTNHPGIVRVFKTFDWQERTFLVMEYLDHPTLKEVLLQAKPPLLEALRMAERIAAAVAHAHAKGVIHRDLKPHNIAVLPDGSIKLFDFGIALMKGSSFQTSTSDGRSFGTPEYMSPEQCLGQRVDERTDVYALGVILYEMLTGRPPFLSPEGDSEAVRYMHRYEPVPPMSRFEDGIPEEVERLANRALKKRVVDRVPTARAFAANLKKLRRSLDSSGLSGGRLKGLGKGVPLLKALYCGACGAGAAGAAVAAAAVVVLFLGTGRQGKPSRDLEEASSARELSSAKEAYPAAPFPTATSRPAPNDSPPPTEEPTEDPGDPGESPPPPASAQAPVSFRPVLPSPTYRPSPAPVDSAAPSSPTPRPEAPTPKPSPTPKPGGRESFAQALALVDRQDYPGAIEAFQTAQDRFAEEAREKDDQWHLVQACRNARRLCDRMMDKKTSPKVFHSSMAILRNEVLGEGPSDVKSTP